MDRCPKCGSRHDHIAQARASHGGTFYVCGTFVTSGGETSLEGETCLRHQLAAANERADRAEDIFLSLFDFCADRIILPEETLAARNRIAAHANREGK